MPVSLTLFLAAMAASLMVSGAAAIAALREPGLGLKPLWALLALTGPSVRLRCSSGSRFTAGGNGCLADGMARWPGAARRPVRCAGWQRAVMGTS